MNIEFELAAREATRIVSVLPYYRAARMAEKEGKPHIIIYVADDAFSKWILQKSHT